jgi:hypothetical protein
MDKYFSHDANATNDPKIMLLIDQLGLEGYGIYWVLIELLRSQPDYKYPIHLIPILARRFNNSAEKFNAIINSYNLFIIEDETFFSLSLLKRMELMEAKSETARKAALIKWDKYKENKQLMQTHSERNANAMQMLCNKTKLNKIKLNKTKEKESKNTYADLVTLTEIEYNKLIDTHGLDFTKKCIDKLNAYKLSKGKTYKSDYGAINTWVVEAVKEKEPARVSNFIPPEKITEATMQRMKEKGFEVR